MPPPLPAALVDRRIRSVLRRDRRRAGQKLAFVYFEEEPGRRSAAKLLTKDDRLIRLSCGLPDILRRERD